MIASLVLNGVGGIIAIQNSSAQAQERLSAKIPAPIRAKYRTIRDARDWLNPIITLRAEGIEVDSRAIPSGRKTVASAQLRTLLVSLPVSAWPYGRVVIASEIGLRQVDRSDEEPIKRNHEAAEKVAQLHLQTKKLMKPLTF